MTYRDLSDSATEIWAGIECTVNRVHDTYYDQLESSGHSTRLEDLDLFAQLGIRAMRYPILWERMVPESSDHIDWTWTDSRLDRLRVHNIRPIVGLVHHGSGPRHTSLVESSFAEGLAHYACLVAQRYPWVQDWTPVNEPLTTARFSGLYGHWYPHGCDEQTFARALVNQCRGTVLAMRAIRRINPAARLVQTDDLGKVYSTPRLRHQADFENERRWLTWDLLSGRVDRSHRMWEHLRWAGIDERELHWFLDNACAPDILGINHYVTSERYLDEHFERYPPASWGDNGREPYADVEAVRVLETGMEGIRGILKEAWDRYRRPLAVTEVHLGCTREEQMRWLLHVWNGVDELRHGGVDVRAITAWALLGSFEWNSLLTRREGHYEAGIFDLRGPAPRPTALAGMVREMADGKQPTHPVLAVPGWWQRPQRLIYSQPGTKRVANVPSARTLRPQPTADPERPLLITGAGGTLGSAFARLCDHRGLPCCALSRSEMDIADPASVESALTRYRPWAVINAAGFVRVDEAEQEPERCFRENTSGPALLAAVCALRGLPLLTFSSDLVFNGRQQTPYRESDRPAPKSAYGQSKAKVEALVQAIWPAALIVRTSALFGPWDSHNFLTVALRELGTGGTFAAASDAVISPTYVPDLVHACLDLILDGESGLWHLANAGAVTWAEFAEMAAERAGLDVGLIEAVPTRALQLKAERPLYSVLGSDRGQLLQPLDKALECYFQDAGDSLQSLRATEHERRPGIHEPKLRDRVPRCKELRPARKPDHRARALPHEAAKEEVALDTTIAASRYQRQDRHRRGTR